MKEEKTINAGKQENQLQNQFADELLSDDDLDKVAGGTIGRPGSKEMILGDTSGK